MSAMLHVIPGSFSVGRKSFLEARSKSRDGNARSMDDDRLPRDVVPCQKQ